MYLINPPSYTNRAGQTFDLVVGLPVTYCIGSDRYADKITHIERNGKTLHCDHGVFTYRKKSNTYKTMGQKYGTLIIGHAENYRDPSF